MAEQTRFIAAMLIFLVMEVVLVLYLRQKVGRYERKAFQSVFWVGIYLMFRLLKNLSSLFFAEAFVVSDALLLAARFAGLGVTTALAFRLHGKLWPEFTIFGRKRKTGATPS